MPRTESQFQSCGSQPIFGVVPAAALARAEPNVPGRVSDVQHRNIRTARQVKDKYITDCFTEESGKRA